MAKTRDKKHVETRLIHQPLATESGSGVVPPLSYSTTFKAKDASEFSEMANEARHPRFYTRYGNPTHEYAAELIADLEGGESALLCASGMGAISSTLLAFVSAGDHVVAQSNHYMGTAKMVSDFFVRFGVESTLVDQTDAAAFEKAIRPNTKLIITETPANPSLSLTDLEAVAKIAKKKKILTVCDNTFASPINQNPIEHGIDLVVHSATKFLGGHHDITAGVVVGTKAHLEKIWRTAILLGPTLSPMDAWLLLRGMRTLALRVERQNATALELASMLEKHPKVEAVFYPGLKSHPQLALAKRQMRGFGGVFAMAVRGGYKAAKKFAGSLEIPVQAVSLGGVESLIVHAAAMWEGALSEAQMKEAKILPNLIRVSVGIENSEDLKNDFSHALERL